MFFQDMHLFNFNNVYNFAHLCVSLRESTIITVNTKGIKTYNFLERNSICSERKTVSKNRIKTKNIEKCKYPKERYR